MITQKELGQRISEARIRSGLTQEQVAEAMDMARTAITQIEKGNRQVSSLELVQFGRLFGVDIRDLIEGLDPNEELLAFFRGKRRDYGPEVEKAVKEALPICRVVSNLEDMLEEQEEGRSNEKLYYYPKRMLAGDPKNQGKQLASMERERLGLGYGPIPDLMLLAFQNGLIVVEHDMPEEISGIYLKVKNGRSFILLHKGESYGRKRFSLAHEYCHSLVDSHELIIVSKYNEDLSREYRANAFASAFLLPKEGILQFASENSITPNQMNFTHVAKLAVRFGLSYEATVIALDQAGFIAEDKKIELQNATKNANGYIFHKLKFREPQFNRITLHEWAFHKTIRALEEGIISVRKGISIAKQLGYKESVVRENLELLSYKEDEL